jgi:hypothetical protein
MEEQLLFIVDAISQIANRGCALIPGPPIEPGSAELHVGYPIRLLTPEGVSIHTKIAGIEIANYGSKRPDKITAPILLPQDITKDRVPLGTKVFLMTSPSSKES